MIRIYENTKVFVYCPAGVTTGGVELLHQLVHVLNENGQDAYVVYHDKPDAPTPADYRGYHLKRAEAVADAPEHVLVLAEAAPGKVRDVQRCQVLFWWLSVDFFFFCSEEILSVRDYMKRSASYGRSIFFRRLKRSIKERRNCFRNTITLEEIRKATHLNCYQSEYAHHFLLNNGFTEILPMTDYIHPGLASLNMEGAREDKILYNPKKGFEFTSRLIAAAPHLKWTPLQHLSRDEMLRELRSSKLYIDFGYHPGKDRIPREAAINGCCVVTNLSGAARYFEDVPIDSDYKIDERKHSIADIIARLEDILANYHQHITRFAFYRQRILKEEEAFVDQVKQVFGLCQERK